MTNYLSPEGVPFTDDDLKRWALDAENGFPDSDLTPVQGRPWEARTQPMEPHTIRVPASLWHLVRTQAAARGITTSEYTRDALTRELAEHHG